MKLRYGALVPAVLAAKVRQILEEFNSLEIPLAGGFELPLLLKQNGEIVVEGRRAEARSPVGAGVAAGADGASWREKIVYPSHTRKISVRITKPKANLSMCSSRAIALSFLALPGPAGTGKSARSK